MRVTSTWQLSLAVAATLAIGVLIGYLIAPAQEPQIVIPDELQELVNEFRREVRELEQEVREAREMERAHKRAHKRAMERSDELMRELFPR